MVYLYKKKVGSKYYYYLRLSKRSGGKQIVKDVAYLGSSIEEARVKLKKVVLDKKLIRKSYRKINLFIEREYYKKGVLDLKLKKDLLLGNNLIDIEACRLHYKKSFGKLDESIVKEIIRNFSVEFAYNTTSIEGNTITLEEARDYFESGRLPGKRTLREVHDLDNTNEVMLGLFKKKGKMNNDLIIGLHKRLMNNIDKRVGYRDRDVRVFGSRFDSIPGIYVKSDMDILLKWYEENKDKLHPFVLAVIFHHKFEKIHPFYDGNGRTGRMLMNYILIRAGYPPVLIYRKNRNEYLDVLRSADKANLTEVNKKYKQLISYVVEESVESYWNLFL